jgi:glycosyltransferase involved in cell wall biosynthesis
MNQAVLSIYTATYNRKDILEEKIKRILSIRSDDIDYFVLDDCSDDGTLDMLAGFDDPRLHVLRNGTNQGSKQDGVMQNWFKLLEVCDGQFAFHLNDRDIIDTGGLQDLCAFLKGNPTLTGGICDSIGGGTAYTNHRKKHL